MKITHASVQPYCLRLKAPLRTAHGTFVQRDGFVVHLHDAEGRKGAGDAAPWPGFGSAPEVVQTALEQLVPRLKGVAFADLPAMHAWVRGTAWPEEVAHAVELACLDLMAQAQNVSVARLLNPAPATEVAIHMLVRDAVSAQDAVRAGARVLKMKVGGRPLEEDVVRVGAIRAAVGGAVALRLDANGSWTTDMAFRAARLLAAFEPQWLEQPVVAEDVAGLRAVRDLRAVPIAADEAVQTTAGLQAVLKAEAADVVVLKPMFIGGLLQALEHHALARRHGVQTLVTHALESAVGRLGALHLAAALHGDLAHGLASPLAEDLAQGPQTSASHCPVPTAPGLGLVWHEAAR